MKPKSYLTVALLLFAAASVIALAARSFLPNPQAEETPANGVIAYYFHGVRCPTCLAAESQAHETVRSDFASQLDSGEVIWKVLDYVKDPGAAKLAKKFGVADPAVVLARMKDGQIEDWRVLDRVLVLVNDKPAFAAYIRDEIGQMLKSQNGRPTPPPDDDRPDLPIPDPDVLDIPIPTDPADVAVPQ